MDLFNPSVQEQGVVGKAVGAMIRRTVHARFYNVYWGCSPNPMTSQKSPTIFVCNHHGWHDGYIMYLVAKQLGIVVSDWIEEYHAFPLFGKIGGLPFPKNDSSLRAKSVRTTIKRMKQGCSLLLFAEGKLHRGPHILPFSDGLANLLKVLPAKSITPVALVYEQSIHERPEVVVSLGSPIDLNPSATGPQRMETATKVQAELATLLEQTRNDFRLGKHGPILYGGTLDVNERYGFKGRSIPKPRFKPR